MNRSPLALDLAGKLAVVTGGSGELGRRICETLARCGADVAIGYYENEEAATSVAQGLTALGRRAIAAQVDVNEERSVQDFAAAVQSRLGAPSIVVANAVVQIHPWKSVLEEEISKYESQFRSCVLHSVFLAKAFVPAMIERSFGRFIAINTECTMQLLPTYSAYTAGKRGMDAVMRVLAREVGQHNITVNQVAPGWTISDKDQITPGNDADYVSQVPLRRRGTDQEIANVVAFLASDLASYVHGAFVPVCGGNVMPTV
ncbi:MAG TPA: SDR family oxidoreductase [Polyangiaceae bacterium]|nr:SDR family oxidoreductase [Polyangiaceae bacterium]